MKTVVTFTIFLIFSIQLFSQCDLQLQEQIELDINKDKATFLKQFSADLKGDAEPAKYSMALDKRRWYRFYIYESDKYDGKGHFELYQDNPKMLLGSNMNKETGERHISLDFKCNEENTYHLYIVKDDGERYCSEVVLAHIGKLKDEGDVKFFKDSLFNNEKVYFMVDEMPVFKESNKNYMDFRQWMGENLKYPEEAIKQKIEGRVFVQFVVSEEGEVKNVRIVRGVHQILDDYTLELIKSSPKWLNPGYLEGKAVNVAFTFPVEYVLEKEEKK